MKYVKWVDGIKYKIPNSLKNLREEYPNAYKYWNEQDDLELIKLVALGKSHAEIAKIFQREIGAITARIKKVLH